METIKVRLKNGRITDMTPKAAKIAINHLGATEIKPPVKPIEVGTKTKPPVINKPIRIIEPSDDLAKGDNYPDVIINDDLGLAGNPVKVPEKKTRKKPVRSKTK